MTEDKYEDARVLKATMLGKKLSKVAVAHFQEELEANQKKFKDL